MGLERNLHEVHIPRSGMDSRCLQPKTVTITDFRGDFLLELNVSARIVLSSGDEHRASLLDPYVPQQPALLVSLPSERHVNQSMDLMILLGTDVLPVDCGCGWGWAKPFRSTDRTRRS